MVFYNGVLFDNVVGFVEWLEGFEEGRLNGVFYVVFGCGNWSWVSMYQWIFCLIDDMMKVKGVLCLIVIGEGDVVDDFESYCELWENCFWKEMMEVFVINEIFQKEDRFLLLIVFFSEVIEMLFVKVYGVFEGNVLENWEFQMVDSLCFICYIELQIFDVKIYKEGDYIGILLKNSQKFVQWVFS